MANKPEEAEVPSQVLKAQEYLDFLALVQKGLWKNNTLLADACSVEDETIAKWKKLPEIKKARHAVLVDRLGLFRVRGDVEKQLQELGMEFDTQTVTVNIVDQLKKDKNEFGI